MLTIQKIETVKRNPSKVKLVFEDSSYIVSIDTVALFSLYEGREVSEEDLSKIVLHGLFSDLQERTIGYITYSPRTEYQVRQYIQKYLRKIDLEIDSESLIEELIEKLKEYKYIDDRAYAELFVKSRLQNKPKSRFVLSTELFSKGIDKELSNEVLDELLPENIELLKKVYEKKFGDTPITFDDKKKISFLQRKGFSWDDISTFVNSFKNDGA
jgi:regulatory protein